MNSNVEMSLLTRRSTPGPDVGRRALEAAAYSRPPVDKRTPRGAHAMLRKISNSWNLFWWGKGTYPDRDNKIEDVFLRFYTGSTFGEYEDIRLAQATKLLQHPKFDRSRPTVLYAHGFQETALQESVQVMVTAYLEARPNTNVVLLDWSNMAFGSYFINAAPNTKKVGIAAAERVSELVTGGLDPETLHVIGHSLGGQLVGFLARNLTSSYNVTLPRITALDPAFPEFYPGVLLAHISPTDARVVDIVHTDAGGYGAPVRGGTADFWPNGGKAKQPGCPRFTPIPLSDDDLCSHWRSWRFYAESVRTPRAFAAAPAESYFQFKNDTRPEKAAGVVYMGADMDPKANGNYYLITNAASPFGKGLDGIYYQKDKKK